MGNSVEIMLTEEERKELEFIATDIFPKSFYDCYKRPGAYDDYKRYLEESAHKRNHSSATNASMSSNHPMKNKE